MCLNKFIYIVTLSVLYYFFFFQAEDGIRDRNVTGVQTCALPILKVRLVPRIRDLSFTFWYLTSPNSAGRFCPWSWFSRGLRSEERRVGKECRVGGCRDQ